MAYGNWGAVVLRNGERMRSHEDNVPYAEDTNLAGYHNAFGVQVKGLGAHHAIVGSGRVRVCGYKSSAYLFVDGVEVSDHPIASVQDYGGDGEGRWSGAVEGCEILVEATENFVEISMTEPDGSRWFARCGYEFGAGHGNDERDEIETRKLANMPSVKG